MNLILQISIGLFCISFSIGLCCFLMKMLNDFDQLICQCIDDADDSELDCWGW